VTLEYGLQQWEPIWLVVKEDFEKAGVRFNLKLIDSSTLIKKVSERHFKLHFQSWSSLLFPNPETSWRSSLASQMNNNNITGFKNPRVDELCKQYNVTMDRAEQKKIIREIDTLVCDDVPYAFGWYARFDRILFWDKFGHPASYLTKTYDRPELSILLTWWFDEAREKALKEAMEKDTDLPQGEMVVKPWG
jgi:microcin C transport system substrate-binding protein